MTQYISKSALVAEINRVLNSYDLNEITSGRYALVRLRDFLDTIEVKEVDDEKCKEYDKALSIAKSWYKSSDSSAQERNVARMIMGDKVREEL